MIIELIKEFERDVKVLSKKYKTLLEDIEVVKSVLIVNPYVRPPFSFRINNLGLETCVIKVKKMASRSFKGKGANSGFRLVYAHFEEQNKIVLVEIYHKSIKSQEYRKRIIKNFD